MPSVLNSISNSVKASTSDSPSTPSSPPLSAINPKKKFRTFGIASRSRSPAVHNGGLHSDTEDDWQHPVLITTGNDSSSTAEGRRRRHPSVTDTTFFESSSNIPGAAIASSVASKKSQPPSTRSRASSLEVEEMKIDLVQADAVAHQHQNKTPPATRSAARPNFRLIPQWGPWSVSVAETPTDPSVYNIYIKTPTHNYTLTRTQREIVELHSKIRDAFPTVTLPPFPLANVAIAPQTPLTPGGSSKRRSSFLHTLSRLANPTPNGKTSREKKDARPSTAGGGVPQSPSTASVQPAPTPPAETTADPFTDVALAENPLTASAAGNVITALAAYLTAVSNDSKLRGSRPWKRFIRVRTDDLESVRVERAIKRVRSDLAAHTGKVGSMSAAAKDMVARKTMMDVGTGPSMLSLGPAFGVGDLGMAGLTADGGFQSEMDGESEASDKGTSKADVTQKIPPVPPIPAHLINAGGSHEKEGTAKPTTTALDTSVAGTSSKADKRVSSVMALQSAFSSDTDSLSKRNSVVQGFGSGAGSAPPTPTPGTAELPSNKVSDPNPEDVELPPSPKAQASDLAGEDAAAVTGLPTPMHSPHHSKQETARIPRRFKDSSTEADGDTSVAEGGDVTTDAEARSTTTNDAGDPTAVVINNKSKKRVKKAPAPQKKVTLEDFEMLRVLGKGCAGKVLLVKYKKSSDLYALKSITKRHVLAHQELQHTLTEQAVLKRMSREGKDPFVVKLWWSFHDKDNLYLVMDFHPGGDLATQLARWGRLGRDRARFYAAEIVEGVEGLHAAGVIYRDLKPENILIGADGHIVLTDFGLSKEFPRRIGGNGPHTAAAVAPDSVFAGTDYYAGAPGTDGTPSPWVGSEGNPNWGSSKDLTSTFCGTAEYLAPEVIQGLPYSYEVDWWSFGTMLYEMLSGITPFWANNHSDMYVRVLQDELQFPEDRAMDQDTKSLIRGLLQRNPSLRMSEPRIKRHPYFSMIDWDHVYYKRYIPPYIPPIDPSNASDTQNFDETFLEMEPTVDNDDPPSDSEREKTEDEGARTDGAESIRKAEGAVTDISSPTGDSKDVFDGYSFKGRHSVVIDEEDSDGYADEEEEPDDELVEAKKITDALAARHQQPQEPRDDVSETGTIEQAKGETSIQEAISATPSTSTAPDSAVSASIVTDAESVVAPKAPKEERKQASESTERSSTIPSLTTGTTGTMSSSKDLTESPTVAEYLAQSAAAARILAEGSFDEAVQAPLPLSPVLEAIDPTTGVIADEPLSAPPKAPEAKPAPSTPVQQRTRGKKSGIPVLERIRREEDEDATERDEDDWDLVEAPAMQERNGAKGLNLWQRGVVDRYRLAVFRKSGTSNNTPSRIPRSVSGATHDSQNAVADISASPSPSQSKHKRGRTGGISLRKSTRDFLRAKSPSANFSTQSSAASRASLAQASNSATVNGAGLLTPSPSVPAAMTKPVPSLKSKSSALSKASVNSPPSSDQSVTDLRNQHAKSSADVSLSTPVKSPMSPRSLAMRSTPAVDEGDQPRPSNLKKMKKYTEQGAEKMFSLFGSPRHQNQQHHS